MSFSYTNFQNSLQWGKPPLPHPTPAANLRFPTVQLWRVYKSMEVYREKLPKKSSHSPRTPDLWIHRAVLYQYATNKALCNVVYLRNKAYSLAVLSIDLTRPIAERFRNHKLAPRLPRFAPSLRPPLTNHSCTTVTESLSPTTII